jgi:hypothetical protein
MLYALCKQFQALPSEVRAEDAGIIRMMKILNMGSRQEWLQKEEGEGIDE